MTRFGLSVDDLIHYALMSGVLLIMIVAAAAILGGLLRLVKYFNER